ncbi:MAG: vitamin B12-dependent ribonucleotide reductase [Nitrospirota bacterium]
MSESVQMTGESMAASAEHPVPKISPNALKVLKKRYLAKDELGVTVETPQQLFERVARNIAQAERAYGGGDVAVERASERFYSIMAEMDFLPNSPTLMNAGRELQQLSACFVLPVGDSMEDIFETVKQAAIIHKTGGGTGFSFSRLRPKDDVVRTTGGVASGPVSFMKVFNHATEAVKQGGTRRGANMGILRVDHPDIVEFITCKTDTKEITNFNISVAITDRFMEAVERGTDYDVVSPRTGQPIRQLSARDVFDRIATAAWRNGEPGLFFIDVTNRANPTPHVAAMEATNPCGEQPLLPYESCNLGSINVERHVVQRNGRTEVDWSRLEQTIRTSVRFLDNVIDMNNYPIPQIEEITKANRKIGLGIMGFARLLFKLGIPYDSNEGIEMGRQVMKFFRDIGYDESRRLADERGPYAYWEGSLHQKQGNRLRNSYVTTVAPTGTISMIADTSGGCEPEFSLIWYKNVMDGEHLPYVLEDFIDVAKREGFWHEGLIERILNNHGSARGLTEVPEKWQRVFATSHDIAPEWHVRMQAAFQAGTDSAVSKTINLPEHATVEDVKKAYLLAYTLGCKGITVYRDGSREEQVLNVGKSGKAADDAAGPVAAAAGAALPGGVVPAVAGPSVGANLIMPKPRPRTTTGCTSRTTTSCGDLYVTVNQDEAGRAFEVFNMMGKSGGCEASFNEAIGRLISLALRAGADPRAIVKQLVGIRCDKPTGLGPHRVLSCSDAIAKSLADYLSAKAPALDSDTHADAVLIEGRTGKVTFPCPDCGCELKFEEGCEKCGICGYSRCS